MCACGRTHVNTKQEPKSQKHYSTKTVSRISGLSPRQVRNIVRRGFCNPAQDERGHLQFSFRDLVLFRNIKNLVDSGASMRKTLRTYSLVAKRFKSKKPLSSLTLSREGSTFLWQENERLWNAETGQAQLDFRPPQQAPTSNDFRACQIVDSGVPIEEWPQDQVADWYAAGLDLEDRDRPLEAAFAYVEALKRDSRHANAMVNLGRLHHLYGTVGVAKQLYESVIELQRDHQIALYNLGTVYDELEELDEAIRCYLRAPDIADAHFNLSQIYDARGEEFAARKHQKRYEELADSDG